MLTSIKIAGKKISFIIKTLFAFAIMIILAIQLIGLIQDANDYYRRWLNRDNPHGNPTKVQGDGLYRQVRTLP